MRVGFLIAIASLAFGTGTAVAAGTIFKCRDANGGTIFSPTPCGKDAKEIRADGPSSLKSDAHPTNDAIQGISDSVADIHCRDDAYASTSKLAEADIRTLELRKQELQQWADSLQTGMTKNDASAEVRRSSYVQEIIAIDQRIESKRQSAETAYRQGISNCDAKRDQRQAAGTSP
jgi:hypothetical protein